MGPNRSDMHDDPLLRPSLDDTVPSTSFRDPWNPTSMFYVAFFGGALPFLAIAVANARRHALGKRTMMVVAGITAAALVAAVVLVAVLELDSRDVRFAARGAGVLAYLAVLPLFRPSQRLFEHHDREWASLWGPGLAAVLVGGAVQALLLYPFSGVAG